MIHLDQGKNFVFICIENIFSAENFAKLGFTIGHEIGHAVESGKLIPTIYCLLAVDDAFENNNQDVRIWYYESHVKNKIVKMYASIYVSRI